MRAGTLQQVGPCKDSSCFLPINEQLNNPDQGKKDCCLQVVILITQNSGGLLLRRTFNLFHFSSGGRFNRTDKSLTAYIKVIRTEQWC